MSYYRPYFIKQLLHLTVTVHCACYFVGFVKFPVIPTGLCLYWFYRQFAENNYHIVHGYRMTCAGVLNTATTWYFSWALNNRNMLVIILLQITSSYPISLFCVNPLKYVDKIKDPIGDFIHLHLCSLVRILTFFLPGPIKYAYCKQWECFLL